MENISWLIDIQNVCKTYGAGSTCVEALKGVQLQIARGEFLTADNRYCYPLTILDDSSRYSIKIAVSYTHLDVYKRQQGVHT